MPEPSAPADSAKPPCETSLEIPGDVVSETLDDETVLLNLTTGIYFGLNQTGTRVWQLLREHSDVSGIVEHMSAEYNCARSTLEADVRSLVEQLIERGLVARAGANSR